MKTFLTEEEVIELAYEALDMNCPDPDKVHDIALKMDMEFNEELGLYEDIENVYIRILQHRLIYRSKVLYENKNLIRMPENPSFSVSRG